MQTIYLDISNKGVIPTVYAKQNDVGRKFAVILTDSGLPYIPVSGSAFSVWYKGASGEGNYTDIGDKSAFSLNGNKVEVEMIVQMLSAHGDGILCLTLNSPNGNQISSWNIPYLCEKVPGFESEGAKEYYTAFSESVEKLKKVTDNLTPEAIGAAPAGYGLGETERSSTIRVRTVAEVDALVHNGWYQFDGDTDTINGFSHCSIEVITSRWGVTQNQYVNHKTYGLIVLHRSRYNTTTWDAPESAWEWENPPMIFGEEYRTTERWNGSPVYVQAVDLGPLPNNKENKSPYTGIASFVIELNGFACRDGSFYDLTKHPSVISYQATRNDIRVTTNTDMSNWTGYASIKYTK